MDFETLDNALIVAGTPISPSYIHGVMLGILCTHQHKAEDCWDRIQEEILIDNELVNKLFTSTVEKLNDLDDGIELMLPPDDDIPLMHRLEALAEWTNGFLIGMKLADLPSGRLMHLPMVTEVLTDFEQIKEVSFQEGESDENEKYYTEIVEFVRVGALLIYAECQNKDCHQESCEKVH